ncbi:MAG: hypothetical protein WCC41_20150 [Rhodomicrobium sp.]
MGKSEEADQEAGAIRDILSGDLSPLEQANVPARGILEIAEKVVRAKAAAARGDFPGARQFAEAAVSLQDKLPYMEPPYWYILTWPRLFGQFSRFDKWNICQC